jgi:hypothetical protein
MKIIVTLLIFAYAILLIMTACSPPPVNSPVDSRITAFNTLLNPAILSRDLRLIVNDETSTNCTNQQIGDRGLTEEACTTSWFLHADEGPFVVLADWSIHNPERWHADMTLDTRLSVECNNIQSSVEYERVTIEGGEFVACRVQDSGEVVLSLSCTQTQIAYLSADFMQTYPDYVSTIIQTVKSYPSGSFRCGN